MSGAGHRRCCAPCGPDGATFDVCTVDPSTVCAPNPQPPFPYPGTCIDWPAAIEVELPQFVNLDWVNSGEALCEGEQFNATGGFTGALLNTGDPQERFDYELQGPNPFQLPCEAPDEFNSGGILNTGAQAGLFITNGAHLTSWFSNGIAENYSLPIRPAPSAGGLPYQFPGDLFSIVRGGDFDQSQGFFGYYKDYAIRDVNSPTGEPCIAARLCVGCFFFASNPQLPFNYNIRYVSSVCVRTPFEGPLDYLGSFVGRIMLFMRSCNFHDSQIGVAAPVNIPLEVINHHASSNLVFDGWTLGFWNKNRPNDTDTGMADCSTSSVDLDYVAAATDDTQGPSSVVGSNMVLAGSCTPLSDVGSVTFPSDICFPVDLTEPYPIHYRTVP